MNPTTETYVRLTLEDIFNAACDLPPARRMAYLDEACDGNTELRRKVEAMLRHHDDDEDFLETPAVEDAFKEIAAKENERATDQSGQAGQAGQARQPMIGRQIGNYRIQAMLGKGGMGEVYLAHDDDLDVDVAIKFLTGAYADDPEWQARFNREGRLNHELTHENIAALRHKGQCDGRPFLVFEYIPGLTLNDKLENGPLSVAEALPIFKQLAAGLAHAHSKNIIHRDLKPANIKITPDDKVKILDFGIARRITTDLATVEMKTIAPDEQMTRDFGETIKGEIIGTVVYMSPEQTRGEMLDAGTDLWSLACVMYQTLTGRLPFKGVDTYDTLNLIRDQRHDPDWRALPANTPKTIQRLLRQCFVKSRQRRLSSAVAIVETIEQLLSPAIKRWKRIALAATALLVVALPVILYLMINSTTPPTYLAVLPFKETGQQQVRIGDGLAKSLRDSLATVPSLKVLPYTSSGEAKFANTSPDVLMKAMSSSWILSGEIEHRGDEVEVRYKLYGNKRQQPFEGSVKGSRRNYAELRGNLIGTVTQWLKSAPPNPANAVSFKDEEKYLTAITLLQGDLNEETIDPPIKLLEELAQTEPQPARVQAMLARAYIRKASLVDTDAREWTDKAFKASEEALRLDANLPEVKVTRGMVLAFLEERAQAISILKEAWQASPGDSTAALELARTFEDDNQHDEAERIYKEVIANWPGYWLGYNELGAFYFERRRYNEALTEWLRVLEINRESSSGWENVSAAYFEIGNYPQSEQTLRTLLETRNDLSLNEQVKIHSGIGVSLFFQQRYLQALESYKTALNLKPDAQNAFLFANLSDALRQVTGEENATYDAYSKAIEIRRNSKLSETGRARLAETFAKRSILAVTTQAQSASDRKAAVEIVSLLSNRKPDQNPLPADALYSIIKTSYILGDLPTAINYVKLALAAKQNLTTLDNDPELIGLRQNPDYQQSVETFRNR